MNQKGQALIFILLGIVMAAFVGVAFYAGKITPKPPIQNPAVTSTPQPTASPSPTPDETANWKTYTNEKFGYQINHPNLLLNQCNVGGIDQTDTLDLVLSQGKPMEGTSYCGTYTISVFVFPTVTKSIPDKLESFISFQTERGGIYGGKREDYIQTNEKMGSISATKLTAKTNSSFAIYAFSKEYTGYYILINDTTGGLSNEEIDQILSTFNFYSR